MGTQDPVLVLFLIHCVTSRKFLPFRLCIYGTEKGLGQGDC